jgi:DNA-binding CsgD family transcriptional regulator
MATAWPELRGRGPERATLTELLASVRGGRSQVLVVRGEAGIGKTALLEVLVEGADGCQIVRAAGVESELLLAYAGLHQLCRPHLARIADLPAPQREALQVAFGLETGAPPDRFLVGLAVLTLLCELAEERPVICVVDDAQWLDPTSAQTLEFVGRRLGAEPVGMVFAVRSTDDAPRLAGLPEIVLGGLGREDAAALLASVVPGRIDARVQDRILAECRGNPLALIELPRATDLAFGATRARATEAPLIDRLEQQFTVQLRELPDPARQLLLAAAADPVGDLPILWRAANRLGIGLDAATAAESAGLIELRDGVRFRHPLVRSAVYQAAEPGERRVVHEALAAAADPTDDPDRRNWHLARAAVSPDEGLAAALEASADRALSLGGLASAASFLESAATLTPDPSRRAQRLLDAGRAKVTAGLFDEASTLLAAAEAGPLDDARRAVVDLLRAQISYNSSHGSAALPMMLTAARRLEPLDPALARATYLDAMSAAMFAGRLAPTEGSAMTLVAETVRSGPPTVLPTKADDLLDGLAVLYTDGYAASAPVLQRAVQAFGDDEMTFADAVRAGWLAAVVAVDLWDDVQWDVLTRRYLEAVRGAGALGLLPLALASRATFDAYSGDLAASAALVAESRWVAEVTGGLNALTPMPEACLAAVRGHEQPAELLIQDVLHAATELGQGVGVNMMYAARALLYNGLGRYDEALAAAVEGALDPAELGPPNWALSELIEAGVRSGNRDLAVRAFEQLAAMTSVSGTNHALGMEASRRALLAGEDATAEVHYRESIQRLSHSRIRVEHARAQLLYGEWLRRQGRRVDARGQLRAAFEALAAMGVDAFAERARRELAATGETVRRRTVDSDGELTPQEAHIARLAAEGLTNPEIAAALYLSSRTVEWHLRKIFTKLGVTSRRQLRRRPGIDADP